MKLKHTHEVKSDTGIKLELWEDNNGRWHWVLKNMSWEIARSRIEGYDSQFSAERSVYNGVLNACNAVATYFGPATTLGNSADDDEVETTVVETIPSMMQRQAD